MLFLIYRCLLIFSIFYLNAYADNKGGTATPISSAVTLTPGEEKLVYFDTTRLQYNVPYSMECKIDQIISSSSSVNTYFIANNLNSTAVMRLDTQIINRDGLLKALNIGKTYILTMHDLDLSPRDPISSMTVKNIDGSGQFHIGICYATPILG